MFLLYGYYRAVNQPQMSVILTIASLGSRVALAYLLSATPLGVTGIWLSLPLCCKAAFCKDTAQNPEPVPSQTAQEGSGFLFFCYLLF